MLETYILEFYFSALVIKLLSIYFLGYNWFLLKHMHQILDINLRLINLPKQRPHIKQRPTQL